MKITELKIRTFGDPVLRRKAYFIKGVTDSHRETLSHMAELMYSHSGIGLAGPQVGESEALIVVDIGTGLYKLANPRVIKKSGRRTMEEGCLSIPGVCLNVKRAGRVLISAQDESGKPVNIEAEDLLASVFQHEIDHLKGKLIVDYASFFDKLKIKKALKALEEKSRDEELPQSERKSCKLQL